MVYVPTMDHLAFLVHMVGRCRQAATDMREGGANDTAIEQMRALAIRFEIESVAIWGLPRPQKAA
jgi:hypothetical protein